MRLRGSMVTSDLELLRREIFARPGDDALRLAYSDALEERGGPGDLGRAECIRVQIEAESAVPCPDCSRRSRRYCEKPSCRFGLDDRALTAIFDSQELRIGGGMMEYIGGGGLGETRQGAFWRRGFVESVRLDIRTFLGGPCRRCHGSGAAIAAWDSGHERCLECIGSGRIEGVARRLFEEHPVTRVEFTCRDPSQRSPVLVGSQVYQWNEGDPIDAPYLLPAKLLAWPNGSDRNGFPGMAFLSQQDSIDWLSRLAVTYGRKLAGWPPLAVGQ